MKYLTLDDIPEEFKDTKAKAKFIRKKIESSWGKLESHEKSATVLKYKLGRMFLLIKEILKEDKLNWVDYFEKESPHIDIRTAQRYMKLANSVDLESHRNLAAAGQTRLLSLYNLAKQEEQDVASYLEDNKVDLEFSPEDQSAVTEFRNQIDDLLDKGKPDQIDDLLDKGKPEKKTQTISLVVDKVKIAAELCYKELKSAKENPKRLKDLNTDQLTESIDKLSKLIKLLEKTRKNMERLEIEDDDLEEAA